MRPNATALAGEYGPTGLREGHGTLHTGDGSIYTGGFKAGKMDGIGNLRAADGCVYDGRWVRGEKQGPFSVRSADGELVFCTYHEDEKVGLAIKWSHDRSRAWVIRHQPAWMAKVTQSPIQPNEP